MDWDIVKEQLKRVQDRIEQPDIATDEHRGRVLLERAQILSKPERRRRLEENPERILVLRSGSERRAIPLSDVTEILGDARRTILPGAPPHVAGLIQIRGEIRPVYRLDKLLPGVSETEAGSETLLLLRSAGREFALLAGSVEEVRTVQASSRRPAPAEAHHVQWMTEDHVLVLDAAFLLGEKQ